MGHGGFQGMLWGGGAATGSCSFLWGPVLHVGGGRGGGDPSAGNRFTGEPDGGDAGGTGQLQGWGQCHCLRRASYPDLLSFLLPIAVASGRCFLGCSALPGPGTGSWGAGGTTGLLGVRKLIVLTGEKWGGGRESQVQGGHSGLGEGVPARPLQAGGGEKAVRAGVLLADRQPSRSSAPSPPRGQTARPSPGLRWALGEGCSVRTAGGCWACLTWRGGLAVGGRPRLFLRALHKWEATLRGL